MHLKNSSLQILSFKMQVLFSLKRVYIHIYIYIFLYGCINNWKQTFSFLFFVTNATEIDNHYKVLTSSFNHRVGLCLFWKIQSLWNEFFYFFKWASLPFPSECNSTFVFVARFGLNLQNILSYLNRMLSAYTILLK